MTRMNPPQTLPRLDDFFLFWRARGVIVLNLRQKNTHTHKNWNTMVIDAFYIWEGGTFSVFPRARETRGNPRQAFLCINYHKLTTAQTKILKLTATCMPKRLSNITILIILYNAVLTYALMIIIPATEKKILHSRIDLHLHHLNRSNIKWLTTYSFCNKCVSHNKEKM